MAWYWPSNTSTNPTRIVSPGPTTWVTITSPTVTTATTTTWWSSPGGTGTSLYWANNLNTPSQTTSASQAQYASLYEQQALAHDAYQNQTCQNPYQQSGLGSLGLIGRQGLAAPAIITHQEAIRRDQEAYRRAVREHDEQEMARLLRLIEARERNEVERQRLRAEQAQANREAQQRHAAAHDRARELLLEHLNPAQRETFLANGWFVVEGGRTKTKYRIRNAGAAGNIDVLDRGDGATARLCCHAPSHIPLGDQWLAQKIMLELAEDDFLRIANRTDVR